MLDPGAPLKDFFKAILLSLNDKLSMFRSDTVRVYRFGICVFINHVLLFAPQKTFDDFRPGELADAINDALSFMESYTENAQKGPLLFRMQVVLDLLRGRHIETYAQLTEAIADFTPPPLPSPGKERRHDVKKMFDELRRTAGSGIRYTPFMFPDDSALVALEDLEAYYIENHTQYPVINDAFVRRFYQSFKTVSPVTMTSRRSALLWLVSLIDDMLGRDMHKNVAPLVKKYKQNKDLRQGRKAPFSEEEAMRLEAFVRGLPTHYRALKPKSRRISGSFDFELIGSRDAMLFRLMFDAGLRAAEALSITPYDIRPAKIPHYYEVRVRNGKRGKSRKTWIRKEVAEPLRQALDSHVGDAPYASAGKKDGVPITRSRLYQITEWIFDHAGLEGTRGLHLLRHHFATNFKSKSGNMAVLRDALGHARYETTMLYAAEDDDASLKEFEKLLES